MDQQIQLLIEESERIEVTEDQQEMLDKAQLSLKSMSREDLERGFISSFKIALGLGNQIIELLEED